MNLSQLQGLLTAAGCVQVFVKVLAKNDNKKQQVYFGTNFASLNLFPHGEITPSEDPTKVIMNAALQFGWLQPNGAVVPAPGAQIILYPQYPEVRFSGFLDGCEQAPSELMTARQAGRVLFLGITKAKQIVGFVTAPGSPLAQEFLALGRKKSVGVFYELPLPTLTTAAEARARLLVELGRIHRLQWIDSKALRSDGTVEPCLVSQCGGFTLEAELGIPKNSSAEPDFLGWEVKQHSVTSFARPDSSSAITLMTPEPTGGFYKEQGVEAFIRKFGYPDKNGKPDRLNVGGVHRTGERQASTGLTMQLTGYDFAKGKITDASGAIALVSDAGEVAAAWAFSGLLAHWSRKHMRAAYVPSMRRTDPHWQYAYGGRVRLAQQTDGLRLLKALASGAVYYDPGIKLEHASTAKPAAKKRSQFRVASKNITALYQTVEMVEV
jgi:hypothetical protein